jgi:hypothetical protein
VVAVRPYSAGQVKSRPERADVADVQETTDAGVRCPSCSAAVRPGAPWCTQCYAPVGAAPAPAPEQQPAPVEVAPPVSAGTWPCTTCAQPNDLAVAACAACGTPFLAAVRGQRPSLVLPGVGDLLDLTPVRRVGLAAAVVVGFLVVSVLLALLLA